MQTEDKGKDNPFIESLIYVGGQVVAAKRTGYAEVLEGQGEKAVVEMMDHQHRAMIAAIRTGRFDDKVLAILGRRPAEAAVTAAVGDGAGGSDGKTLDEVILEYLTTEAEQEHLLLLLDEEVELAFGQQTEVTVRTSSSKSGLPVSGAQVTVKMISTADEPRILSAGSTDDQGFLELALEIPELVHGTSALIITASSPLGKAELKYLL